MINNPLLERLRDAGVLAFGIDRRSANEHWGRGIRPTYLGFYVVGGRVTWGLNDSEISAGPGEVLSVPPAAPKLLFSGKEAVKAVYVHLSPVEPWSALSSGTPSVHPAPYTGLLAELVATLERELLSNSFQAPEAAEHATALILHYLRRLISHGDSPHDQELRARLSALWDRIHEEPGPNWTVAALAQAANMSEGHLHRETRRLFGKKPMQIVRHLRLERAASLLTTTNLPLDRIAAEVGYASPFGLSNAFYREFGIRPTRYRFGPR